MRKKVLYVFFIVLVLFAIICEVFFRDDCEGNPDKSSDKGKEASESKKLDICKEPNLLKDKEIVIENKNKRVVYLTFDDGPSKNTYKVLEILDKYDIKATFFVIGANITQEYETLIKDMEQRGHTIGIHTFSHKYNYIYSNVNSYIEDFNKAYCQLERIMETPPAIYRFPGGSCNCYVGGLKKEIVERLKARGFSYFDWTISGEDSVGKPTVEGIIKNVLNDIGDFENPIVLLHDSSINENTVDALESIILGIKERGYEFGVLDGK